MPGSENNNFQSEELKIQKIGDFLTFDPNVSAQVHDTIPLLDAPFVFHRSFV
jgi:hypothetical protein